MAPVFKIYGHGPEKDIKMFIKTLADRFNAWLQYRASIRELQQLTDRELSDLGIARGDIERVVRPNLAA